MAYGTSWRSRLGCFAIGLLVLLAPVVSFALWSMASLLPLTAFDAARWRAAERSDDYSRQDMVGSLLWSGRLERMRRGEVEQMLGPDCACSYFEGWDLVYWLGPERSWLSIDSEWLVIRFDKDGRHSDHALVTD